MKQLTVVRICYDEDDLTLPRGMDNTQLHILLESLRYMGAIKIHPDSRTISAKVVDIYPPRTITAKASKDWAEKNAARMKTFGISTVAAPEWLDS